VFFRKGGLTHGGSFPRVAHFVTKPNQSHSENCSLVSENAEASINEGLVSAIQSGKEILVNLNMEVGKPLRLNFGSSRDAKNLDTPYARWLRTHNYYPISVNNVTDLVNVFNKVSSIGGDKALEKVTIGHEQQVLQFNDFFLDNDGESIKKLVKSMYMGRMASNDNHNVESFPRLIRFKPTKKAHKSGQKSPNVFGSPLFLNRRENTALILLQKLELQKQSLRSDILQNNESYVLAIPSIDKEQLSRVFNLFQLQKKKNIYVRMNWKLSSQDQHASVPIEKINKCAKQLSLF
jgi:hypothetical protein